MATPIYRITHLNIFGSQGMVADRDIIKGEIILEEDSSVVIDTTLTRDQYDDGDNFYKRKRLGCGGTKRTSGTLRRAQENNRDAFRDL
jgi:hypothetical protein